MQMQTPQVGEGIMPEGWKWKWGLGVRIELCHSYLPKGLYGWSGAYGSHFWVDPQNEITAVYMKNSQFDGGAWSVTSVNFEKDVYESLLSEHRCAVLGLTICLASHQGEALKKFVSKIK